MSGEQSESSPWRADLLRRSQDAAGFLRYSMRRFIADDCLATAAALTYTSLLALVPVMTIGFAIFTAFPAFERLKGEAQALLFNNLVPQVGTAILGYLDRFTSNAGQLTAFGTIGLAVTSVLLLSTIEGSFNAIWRTREPRPLVIRLLAFWAILTLAPLLFGAALSLSSLVFGAMRGVGVGEWTGPLAGLGFVLPGLFEWLGFTLLYLVIPYRAVRWQDAVAGAAAAAVLLELSKAAFAWYLTDFPVYQTIYGALSIVPTFLVWLYIAWSTVLFGAVVAAALPEWRAGRIAGIGPEGLLPSQRLAVALGVLKELLTASQFGVGLRRQTLLGRIPVGSTVIDDVLEQLRQSHWVARTSQGVWVTTRDLGEATVYDLQKAMGIGLRGVVRGVGAIDADWQGHLSALLRAVVESDQQVLGVSVKELLNTPPSPDRHGGEQAVPLRMPRHPPR